VKRSGTAADTNLPTLIQAALAAALSAGIPYVALAGLLMVGVVLYPAVALRYTAGYS
jgi:hypothetical protein